MRRVAKPAPSSLKTVLVGIPVNYQEITMLTITELEEALRRSAQGLFSLEAATELLIRHDRWLHREDVCPHIAVTPSLDDASELWASVDWAALIAAPLPCSSSERRMLELAAALAGVSSPTPLGSLVASLDDQNLAIVLAAITHAARGTKASGWDVRGSASPPC